MRKLVSRGFTLVEVVIVLGLIGLLTLMVIAGSGSGIKNDRFSGQVKLFADFIRQSQVKAATTQTSSACPVSTPAPGGNGGNTCFWRGTAINFALASGPGTPMRRQFLSGGDLSQYSGFTDPKTALYGETADPQIYIMEGAYISAIKVNGTATGSMSLAFLAPSGQAYICNNTLPNCTPSTGNSQPFTDGTSKVVFTLKDSATSLTALVTFDPTSGTISTTVQ